MPKAKTESKMGRNRTGVQMAPNEIEKMLSALDSPLARPTADGDESAIAELRSRYISQSGPVGSVPPPGSAKGALKAGAQMLTGGRPQVLLDKLAERLAFERSSTRVYDALVTKCRADGAAGVPADRLVQIRDEEARHFKLLSECIEQLGGDPTAQTPAADVVGVESAGIMQVVTDPKTTFAQSLHAILVAELADNAAWDELLKLGLALHAPYAMLA